jgi:hypothetical protein
VFCKKILTCCNWNAIHFTCSAALMIRTGTSFIVGFTSQGFYDLVPLANGASIRHNITIGFTTIKKYRDVGQENDGKRV